MAKEHIGERIADILLGTLTDSESAAVEIHLERCDECREAVDFARQMQEGAEAQCIVHPNPERLVELSDGAASSDAEQAHLKGCVDCAAELRWLGTHPSEPPTVSSVSSKRRWLRVGGLGTILAAAVVAWLFLRPQSELSNLAVREPLPVNTTRSSPTAEAYDVARAQGLDAYAGGNYDAAIESLREALILRPETVDLKLYLGSALFLEGDARGAVQLLADAATSNDGVVRDASLWQLANARLVLGDRAGAVDALTQLQEVGGRHADRGAALLRAVQDSGNVD